MRTRIFALAIGLTLVAIVTADAQDRATVFVHGLASSSDTWEAAANRLQGSLAISKYVPDLPWRESFESQAGSLQGQLGGLPANTIAIGHSNGGIASRSWSFLHPLGGVMTVGSPQRGAPIVHNLLTAMGFHQDVYNSAGFVFALMGVQPNEWWDLYLFVEFALQVAQGVSWQNLLQIGSMPFLVNHPVIPQMSTASGYLGQLNSSENLAREAAQIPARVGLSYELHNYWRMGLIRLLNGAHDADVAYNYVWNAIGTLETAANLLLTYYPGNSAAINISNWLYRVASGLRLIDPAWCWAVTNDSSCNTPHDGIVPVWSQRYPGGHNISVYGPSHLQETSVSDEVIRYALSTYMQVPPRGSGPPPPPPPSGNPALLLPGEALYPGDFRRSPNGEYELVYQGDGNLVLYRRSDGAPLWATMTWDAGQVNMQHDGNLVVYNSGGVPIWASGTANNPGAYLNVQDDSNLVIYDYYGFPLWARD